ncbi:MAG: hypothetical protein MJE12_31070 [Alphaproteobacteria bacterium]|nr:hypothetical protein [Alphaproteobacteria bacterium]
MTAEPTASRRRAPTDLADHASPLDEADWLDWDHWNAVEEYQDLIDGLSGLGIEDDGTLAQNPEETRWSARFTRQLRRQGLEIED